MTTRIQVVVAHPDDETFGCGSLLLHAAAEGATTAVCCATRGEAGEAPPGTGDVAALREQELRAAADALGVGRVDLLAFADSGMDGEPGPDTLCGAPFHRVVEAVRAPMADVRPDVLVTLDASDGHRDHVRVRDAALTAAEQLGVPQAYLLCLPRSLMRRWADHMRTARPEMPHLDVDAAAFGTPDDEVTTVIGAAEHLPARERAIALHASQTSPYDGLPDDLYRDFLVDVHLRRVLPPWPGGPRETRLLPVIRP